MALGYLESRSTEDGTQGRGRYSTQRLGENHLLQVASPLVVLGPLALVSQHGWDVHEFGNGCKKPSSQSNSKSPRFFCSILNLNVGAREHVLLKPTGDALLRKSDLL